MKKVSIFYCIVVLLLSACSKHETGVIEVITPEEMQSLISLDDVQLVDLRSKEDRSKHGYIENSQHVDYNSSTFEEDIKNLDKTKPVALYCNSGKTSADCANKLKAAGFVKIFDLKGGISEWKHKGNAVLVQ